MFYFIGQLFIGLIVGTLMKLILLDTYPLGLIGTVLLGLTGSIIGTFISYALFGEQPLIGLSLATIGSLIVLFICSRITHWHQSNQPKSLP